jgi:hypothetical protein
MTSEEAAKRYGHQLSALPSPVVAVDLPVPLTNPVERHFVWSNDVLDV